MSEAVGPMAYQNDVRGRRAGDSGAGEWSEDATERIEAEVQAILTRAFDNAVETLSRRRAVLDGMAEALLARGSLEREEFLALLGEAA
jgi:ATP-dependent Zn protease